MPKPKKHVTDIVRRRKKTPEAESSPAQRQDSSPSEKERTRESPPLIKEIPAKESWIETLQKEEQERFGVEEKKEKRRRFALAKSISVAIAIVAFGGLAYSVFEILPRATVNIVLTKTPWTFNATVIASKNAAAVDPAGKMIPAQVMSADKNYTFLYPAHGKRQVADRAHGTITLTNAYATAPQPLVARTRLRDGAGRVFRLTSRVIIPGAKIQSGKLTPSSIDAAVLAAEPGADYNIEPAHFTIPGFAGSPKYKGFYGDSANPMTGGFTGVRPYPTADDAKKAQAAARAGARKNLDSFFTLQIPQGLKVIDGARQFKIIKEMTRTEVDKDGNFGYFIAVQDYAIVFREKDVLDLMTQLARQAVSKNELAIKDFTIQYGKALPDLFNGKLLFTPAFSGEFSPQLSATDVGHALLGKSEAEARRYLLSIPDRDRTALTFWPFWVSSVPNNPARVTVVVE